MKDTGDDKIDLSALDPSADRARWERMVGSITARAVAEHRRRPNAVVRQIATWSRPVMAMAAMAAVGVWLAALWAPASSNEGASPAGGTQARGESSPTLLEWAMKEDQLPPATELFQLYGGDNGQSNR